VKEEEEGLCKGSSRGCLDISTRDPKQAALPL
jgi:hypothetical protein